MTKLILTKKKNGQKRIEKVKENKRQKSLIQKTCLVSWISKQNAYKIKQQPVFYLSLNILMRFQNFVKMIKLFQKQFFKTAEMA